MMQNHNTGHVVIDQELHSMRVEMQEQIRNWLQRRITSTPPDWQQRLPYLARRVEAAIYRACPTKEEYAKNFETPIENRLARILRGLNQQQMELQRQLLRLHQSQQLQLQLQVRQQQLEQEQQQHQHDIAMDSAATSMLITEPSVMESSSASVNNLGDLDLEDVTSGGDEGRLLDARVNKD